MNITFQVQDGHASFGVKFFWKMEIKAQTPVAITDHLIPELFFDYLHVQAGEIQIQDHVAGNIQPLPAYCLKTLFTRPLKLMYSTPLKVFGARFTLGFAEQFWGTGLRPQTLQPVNWVQGSFRSLEAFATQLTNFLAAHRQQVLPTPMFESALNEADWLAHYSARHKRRLYQRYFGLSRKELLNVHNLHVFLAQACDFGAQNPRIIKHVNPDVYYDQPHLNHAFKKLTGLSPVEYFEANSILQDNLMSASYNEDQAS